MPHRLNIQIATRLREMADILEHQGDRGFRSQAYRRAADVVELLPRAVDDILSEEGREGLVDLPAVGEGIASAIAEIVTTGKWSTLNHMVGDLDPETLLMTVPGIGPRMAQRLHRELHVETLEDLELAAMDGRLQRLAGFGPRRVEALRPILRDRLQLVWGHVKQGLAPRIGQILEIDQDYRRKSHRNELKLIAPRRFNPQGIAWLPVMHTHQTPWHFTAMFSNTARAHELNKSRDWVVVFASHDKRPGWRGTVVTETRGALKGKRVVRGREAECEKHYGAQAQAAGAA